jgi:phosphohistidine swiveling domain-containing protein
VRRCWASLWSERAVQYRAQRGIDPRTVRLAVIIQPMVGAQVAGVLFTANPLTGRRHEAVIDANPGLGEAVVSGATTPDHFVVDTVTSEIRERELGDKRVVIQPAQGGGTQRCDQSAQADQVSLTDAQVRRLAALGAQVEAHVGTPVDMEWAFDDADVLWLLQARPITTLFPLPEHAPLVDDALRVYLSFTVQQGTEQPFTPMGIAAVRMLASGLASFLGQPPRDPRKGPPFVTEAASRVYLDVTGALRRSIGRTILSQVMAQAEMRAARVFADLSTDPRLALIPTPRIPLAWSLFRLLVHTRLPWYLLLALLRPSTARTRLLRLTTALIEATTIPADASAPARLAAVERLLLTALPRLLAAAAPVMASSMGTIALASRLLGQLATATELQIVLRGLPGNVTTEMNLALWALAQTVRADAPVAALVRDTPAAQLADAYHARHLPTVLQAGLASFLAHYGHRSVNELDMGVPRWSEDPAYLFEVLASYLRLTDLHQAPDQLFQRAAREAETMCVELTHRAARANWVRGLLIGFLLRRARALGGVRELPRFALAMLLAHGRTVLLPVGAALVQKDQLTRADQIFWLRLPEIYTALDGDDLRGVIDARQAEHERERQRRHVPLVLLSDGTAPGRLVEILAVGDALLHGTPASPGVVTARARVIHDPRGAVLETGEILVAPTTDPGWTPLFLRASGLLMETGGAMAHGAIVAREYGIPAVVGAAGATTRITTGQWITVDGNTGAVTPAPTPDP